MLKTWLFTFLLFTWAPATLAEAGPARKQLEDFAADLDSLSANFSQVITSPDGRVESDGEGQVWLASPNRFRWQYTGEFPELIVADGEHVWQYDEMLEQVTVRSQSHEAADSPLMLLTDLGSLDEQFTVIEAGDWEGAQLVSLESRDPDTEFERVLLGFRDGQLVLMGLEDAFGMRTELHFEAIELNPPLEPGLFLFQPPPGIDVVGEINPDQAQ